MNAPVAQSAIPMSISDYRSSAPPDMNWGQLPASYYHLTVVNGVMYGQLIDEVYQASLLISNRYDESMRPEVLTSLDKSIEDNAEVWAELSRF